MAMLTTAAIIIMATLPVPEGHGPIELFKIAPRVVLVPCPERQSVARWTIDDYREGYIAATWGELAEKYIKECFTEV